MLIQELQRINNSGIPYTHQTARHTKNLATPYIHQTAKLTNDLGIQHTHPTVQLINGLVTQHTHQTAKLTKISEIRHIHLMVQPTKNLVIPYTKIADNYYLFDVITSAFFEYALNLLFFFLLPYSLLQIFIYKIDTPNVIEVKDENEELTQE